MSDPDDGSASDAGLDLAVPQCGGRIVDRGFRNASAHPRNFLDRRFASLLYEASDPDMRPIVPMLEQLIERAQDARVCGRSYHPYFIATDCARVATLASVYYLTRRTHGVSFTSWVAIFAALLFAYSGFLALKRAVLKMPSRSFLQDSVLFLLPLYVVMSFAVGYPLGLALDIIGVIYPVYGGIVRIGCFLGGCCYGVPSDKGVRYPATIFHPVAGWRNFVPGVDPQTRVIPIQLFEASGQFIIAVVLFSVFRSHAGQGVILPLALLCYSVMRFGLDFFRRCSVRPRVGPFSEAQVYGIAVAFVSAVVLVVLR